MKKGRNFRDTFAELLLEEDGNATLDANKFVSGGSSPTTIEVVKYDTLGLNYDDCNELYGSRSGQDIANTWTTVGDLLNSASDSMEDGLAGDGDQAIYDILRGQDNKELVILF